MVEPTDVMNFLIYFRNRLSLRGQEYGGKAKRGKSFDALADSIIARAFYEIAKMFDEELEVFQAEFKISPTTVKRKYGRK